MRAILDAAADKVQESGAVLAGGHTIRDPEPKYGLAVVGTVHPEALWRKSGARPGDALFLTKPLGTGLVLAGVAKGVLGEAEEAGATRCMTELNDRAAEALRGFEPAAVTDVTGFGLFGHAHEVAERSGVARRSRRGPCLRFRARSTRPRRASAPAATSATATSPAAALPLDGTPEELVALGYDPQTAGGLLVSLPARQGRRARGAFPRRGPLPRPDRPGRGGERGDCLLMEAGARTARLRSFTLSPAAFAWFAYAALAALFLIVVSGATVRLTGSGLGCENWPNCGETFLPPKDYNALIEFGNRVAGVDRRPDDARRRRRPPSACRPAPLALLVRGRAALHRAGAGDPGRDHRHPRPAPADRHGPLPALAAALAVAVVVVQGARDVARGTAAEAPLGSAWLALALVPAAGAARRLRDPRHGRRPALGRRGDPPLREPRQRGPHPHRRHGDLRGRLPRPARAPDRRAPACARRARARGRRAALLLAQMAVGEVQWREALPWWLVLVHVTLATAVWVGVVALATRIVLRHRARLP